MSRVFVSPQAGRSARSGIVPGDDEPWGTTSSRHHFRAYEAADARSCRQLASGLSQAREQMRQASARSPAGGGALRSSRSESLPARDGASAVTRSSRRSLGSRCAGALPAWAEAQNRPFPERPFLGKSHYTEHQEEAQQARHSYFPYRDEFAPRSKRLMYELALAKCVEDDDRSTSVGSRADSASCFTVASNARSKASRASSTPVLPAIPGTPPPSAGSHRIEGGAGAVAKRRKECQLKAPLLWPADETWYRETLRKDGPTGLTSTNLPSYCHNGTCAGQFDAIVKNNAMMGYSDEPGIGNIGIGLK